MRLLILTPEFEGFGGGIMTSYRELIPALVRLGVEVTVLEGSAMNSTASSCSRVVDGIRHDRLLSSNVARWLHRFKQFESMPALRRHMAASWAMWEQVNYGESFDVVEACDWGLLFVPPVLQGGPPTIVQCHGSIGQIFEHDPILGEEAQGLLVQMIENELLSCAAEVQANSHANSLCWERRCTREVTTILPAWSGSYHTRADEVSPKGLVIGRLQRWKGPETVCAALELLGPNAPSIDWVGRETCWGSSTVSSGEHLRRLYPTIWEEGLLRRVPPVSPREVALLQKQAKFNLIPSLWDVFNFTAVEAMHSGRPTIVSNGAGACELIEDGRNGFIFDAGSPESLAQAISRLCALSEDKLKKIGDNAAETVRSRLAPQTIAEKRLERYFEVRNMTQRKKITPTLRSALQPRDDDRFTRGQFLEQHSIRDLASHVAMRSLRKVLDRVRR